LRNWTGEVGQQAAGELRELANSFQVAAAIIRGAVSTLDGLAESVRVLQEELLSAVDFAHRYGLVVGPDGEVRQQPGVHCAEDLAKIGQAHRLIQEALTSASKVDDEASAELGRLAGSVGMTDLGTALDVVQQAAGQNQVQMLREALPIGADSATVAAWWRSLGPAERQEFERALPVDLYDLDGIPAEVKGQLAGTDGYNRVETVRWAEQNVNNTDIDVFGNNCANFASYALVAGGLPQKINSWIGTLSSDTWGHGAQFGWDTLDSLDFSHSASWAQADAQRRFFIRHRGEEVPAARVMPGDIIYWEQVGPGGENDPGRTHHAAVVTSVTPDGDIHYTQHSPSRQDSSLDGRLPANLITEGDQRVVFVRPRRTW
jgi:Putative amidase domain